jgi:D-beta-D-heptose 7-phosphate kinase / D-beta-D-heptose 1-phosphate adenosyltransferase
MSADLIDLVERLGQPRVLVLGDLMLDRYIWGNAERISQEAPVVLLHADKREERLGGASSVSTLLRALGAKVDVAGVVGPDADGNRIRQMLRDLGIDHEAVLTDPDRPTTVKERYIGRAQQRHPQQIIRVDYETRRPLSTSLASEFQAIVDNHLRQAEIVLISDYDKGVCTGPILNTLIESTRQRGLRILADPIRGGDYRKYRHCSAITPNRLEAGLATGRTIHTAGEALIAAGVLQRELELEAAVITLDKDGMALCHQDGRQQICPTRPRQVYDITGAGDMVISALAMALAAGADYEPAIHLANVAGGLEVEKIGVATVTRDELLRDILHHRFTGTQKILSRDALLREVESRRGLGQRIAFTNGCFDMVHAGHIQYLQEAKEQADVLVVGLNSDASVQALKGTGRPFHSEKDRALVLAGLQAVDYVTIFDEATPLALIESVRPEVLVKAADYQMSEVAGASFVESYGGKVHLPHLREGLSSTRILQRLGAA